MRTAFVALVVVLLLAGCAKPAKPNVVFVHTTDVLTAVVETDAGPFRMILYKAQAPKTVQNFEDLAGAGFFDGVVFHRVIDGFVIQTGDPTSTGSGGSMATVPSEPGIHFAAGTVGMARDEDPDSATSQWFVDEYPQPHLHDPPASATYGAFTAWAQVIEGMEVVKAIAAAETLAKQTAGTPAPIPPGTVPDRPVEDIKITGITFETVEMQAGFVARYPLVTTGRYVTDTIRTTLELWNDLAAGQNTTLTWYTAPRSDDVRPLEAPTVAARGPDGATTTLAAVRDAQDPFILTTETMFPVSGTWNLTLAAGGKTWAMFDVAVR